VGRLDARAAQPVIVDLDYKTASPVNFDPDVQCLAGAPYLDPPQRLADLFHAEVAPDQLDAVEASVRIEVDRAAAA
jgi:hypothetical protein